MPTVKMNGRLFFRKRKRESCHHNVFNRNWNCGSNLKFIRKEHSRSFTDSNSPLWVQSVGKIGNMTNRFFDIAWHCWCCRNQQTPSRAGPFISLEELDSWRRYSSACAWKKNRWRDDCLCEQSISKKLFAGSSDSIRDDSRYREKWFPNGIPLWESGTYMAAKNH